MAILFLFSILAGFATALSPCILPILPIVLASSVSRGKLYPFGVVVGLIASFCLATLFLAQVIQSLGIGEQVLRLFAASVLMIMALTMIVPKAQALWERLSVYLPQPKGSSSREGILGGILVGVSLGLIWAPCAGPILASITTLVITQGVNFTLVIMLLGFALGIAVPLLLIAYGGAIALNTLPVLKRSTQAFRLGFGILTAITSVLIFFNLHNSVAAQLGGFLPTSPLERLERSSTVKDALNDLKTIKKVTHSELADNGQAPELVGLTNWINTPPLTLESLKGKVILIDFWTYSCVNCLRTLPFISKWYEKYKDRGLVVLGVHAPEFAFERDVSNVQKAVDQNRITYPVALDNSFETWKAFDNQYWPAHYFIDKSGHIRHTHFGEGEYEESEKIIVQLLNEGATGGIVQPVLETVNRDHDYGLSAPGQTPETYLGTDRRDRLIISDSDSLPALHSGVISTGFKSDAQSIQSTSVNDSFVIHVKAKNVFLVAESDTLSGLDIQRLDQTGKIIDSHTVSVKDATLYQIAGLERFEESILRIVPESAGVRLFALTFSGGDSAS